MSGASSSIPHNNNRYFDSNEIVQVNFGEYNQQQSDSQLSSQQKPTNVSTTLKPYPRTINPGVGVGGGDLTATTNITSGSSMYPTVEIPVDFNGHEENSFDDISVQIPSIMDLQPQQQPAYPTYQNYDVMNYSTQHHVISFFYKNLNFKLKNDEN